MHAEPCVRVVFDQENLPAREAPRAVLSHHSRRAHRYCAYHQRLVDRLPPPHDIRPHLRAATTWGQAILMLRWLKDGAEEVGD